ncbi:MAG: thiamine diphosphokinase [Candidatus Zixiibacteriota bacterium]
MRDAVLFLHGRYGQKHLPRFRALCHGRFLIAVDGGYSFFRKTGIAPDLLIGDFDSLKRIPRKLAGRTQVLRFPTVKDKTDVELALDYCLERRAQRIDLIQPSFGEPDQFVGNLMLLAGAVRPAARYRPTVRILGNDYVVQFVANQTLGIRGGRGDMISVIPISESIVLTSVGTAYDASRLTIRLGESRGLRNSIIAARASIGVAGKALVIQQLRHR